MIGSDPIFSVSQFVAVFNQSLEVMYPKVIISGELANFRISKDRWVYFDLKDDICSVKFFGTTSMLPGPLENGMNLEVVGHPRLHQQYGFSVNISNLRVVGEGSIAKAQTMLAKTLDSEGLFSPSRKREFAYPPVNIGLITSVGSAAYADFIKVLNNRWGALNISVVDSLVQGVNAPEHIVGAIDKFNLITNPPDVLVIIRGGGSADDLAAFSTEQVVRAVAGSRIPTLVAIGHESDVSLAELASDRRASTPSNAAEVLVPDKKAELIVLRQHKKYLLREVDKIISDGLSQSDQCKDYMLQLMNTKLEQEKSELSQSRSILEASNPLAPLKKGYAIVRDNSGVHIRTAKSISFKKQVFLQLQDGKIEATIKGKDNRGRQ